MKQGYKRPVQVLSCLTSLLALGSGDCIRAVLSFEFPGAEWVGGRDLCIIYANNNVGVFFVL